MVFPVFGPWKSLNWWIDVLFQLVLRPMGTPWPFYFCYFLLFWDMITPENVGWKVVKNLSSSVDYHGKGVFDSHGLGMSWDIPTIRRANLTHVSWWSWGSPCGPVAQGLRPDFRHHSRQDQECGSGFNTTRLEEDRVGPSRTELLYGLGMLGSTFTTLKTEEHHCWKPLLAAISTHMKSFFVLSWRCNMTFWWSGNDHTMFDPLLTCGKLATTNTSPRRDTFRLFWWERYLQNRPFRMWCAGEIVTAYKNQVLTVPLMCDGYTPPDDEFLEHLEEVWTAQQRQILSFHGISMEDVQQAYVSWQWVSIHMINMILM